MVTPRLSIYHVCFPLQRSCIREAARGLYSYRTLPNLNLGEKYLGVSFYGETLNI